MNIFPAKPLQIAIALLFSASGQAQTDIPPLNSAELNASQAKAVNAYPAWQQGALGQGVVVAVLDTGVNASHVEMKGRIAPGGKNFVEGGDGAPDLSKDGHGTSMAGILAANFNNQGIVGVAYQSQILPIRVVQTAGSNANTSNRVAGINYAAGRQEVRILVSSYSSSPNDAERNAFRNAGAQNKVVIISAGNSENSNPNFPASMLGSLQGAGVAVGVINGDGTIWEGSNRAGDAKNFFLVAPGIGVKAPSNQGSTAYTTWSGTSMASPHVAGVAALLLSHAPDLTNKEVVQLLLSTATDLGEPGVDNVYGHGLVNAAAALSAQGPVEGPDDGGSSSGLGAAVAAVAVGAGVVYWLTKKQNSKKQLENTLVLDSYDRPYIMNMNSAITVRDTGPRLFDVMDMFDRQSRSVEMALSGNLTATMYTSTNNPLDYFYLKDSDPFMETEEQILTENVSLKLNGDFDNGLFFNIQSNQAPGSDFDKVDGMSLSENFIMGSSLSNAYMGFGSSADSMSVGYRYNDQYTMSVGANRIDDNEVYGLKSNTAAVQGTYEYNDRSSLALRLSEIAEEGSLLGGSSGGVLSVSQSKTTALGLTANHKMFDKLSVFANYTHGFTNVNEQNGSFLQDFSGLQSRSYSLGLLGNNLIKYKDKAGIAISSPMRVSDGDVTLVVPHSIDYSSGGSISRTSTRLDMSDAPAELDFEAFYNMSLNRNTNVGTYLTYRDTPSNDSNYASEVAVFATLGMKF